MKLGDNTFKIDTIFASGWTTLEILLPTGLVSPSQHVLEFTYTDACTSAVSTETLFIDEKVAGLSLTVSLLVFICFAVLETLTCAFFF